MLRKMGVLSRGAAERTVITGFHLKLRAGAANDVNVKKAFIPACVTSDATLGGSSGGNATSASHGVTDTPRRSSSGPESSEGHGGRG